MPSVLLVLSSYDIPAAVHMAEGLDADYRTWYFDPTLTEALAASPLRRPELVLPDEVPEYAAIEIAARAQSAAFGDEVAAALQPLTEDVSLRGWQSLNVYYFFVGWHWYSQLWDRLRSRFTGATLHLPLNDNPANFYWPSFIPALLLKERLDAWDITCHAVAYGERADESDAVPSLAGHTAQRWDVLTHLPTCFYDAPYFAAELQAAGRTSINIEPKYWGVPLQPDEQVKMLRVDHAQLAALGLPSVMPHGEVLLHLLHRLLQPLIATHEFCARQALHLAKLYQSQLVTLQLLERYFGEQRPGQILLSDHDAGFHGPLLSYAQRHRIPVLQLPHAKVSISSDFNSAQLSALSHPMQGLPMQRADGRQLRRYPLAYPESYSGDSSSRPLRRVGILLSGISLNGVLSTRPGPYVEGIARIAAWCRTRGLEVAIRNRPGQPLYQPIAEQAGFSRQAQEAGVACTLQQFVQSVDLCLMYDAPTSAAIECLRNQVPILNPLAEPLSPAETLWADAQLIPRAGIEATLQRLDQLRLDENLFNQVRRRQFADYLAACAEAQALRHYL